MTILGVGWMMGCPWNSIIPESAFSKPAIILRRVDFPQPEGPTRQTNSSFPIEMLTSSKTMISVFSDVNFLITFFTSITVVGYTSI